MSAPDERVQVLAERLAPELLNYFARRVTPAADAAADAVPTTPWLALLETSSQGTWGQILDVVFGIVDVLLGVMADTGFHL